MLQNIKTYAQWLFVALGTAALLGFGLGVLGVFDAPARSAAARLGTQDVLTGVFHTANYSLRTTLAGDARIILSSHTNVVGKTLLTQTARG